MSDQIPKEILDPKERLKKIEKIFKDELEFIPSTEVSKLEQIVMDIAEHPELAKDLVGQVTKLIPIKELIEKTGIDLEKEKEIEQTRLKEYLDLLKKQIEASEHVARELKTINESIKIIDKFNKSLKKIKKYQYKVKESQVPKKDPFKVIVPKDFWEDILSNEDILSDEDY